MLRQGAVFAQLSSKNHTDPNTLPRFRTSERRMAYQVAEIRGFRMNFASTIHEAKGALFLFGPPSAGTRAPRTSTNPMAASRGVHESNRGEEHPYGLPTRTEFRS